MNRPDSTTRFDVIVVGGGHAGTEAALASAPNPVGVVPPFTAEEIEIQRNLCPGCRKTALAERGVK